MDLVGLLHISAIFIFLFGFLAGFYLVYGNLKKVNLVEGEKFILEDWLSCTAFGLMFGLALVFASEITIQVIIPESDVSTFAGYALMILLAILFVYPLWEVFFLGRPTSDSVHDFHKFLETKILDRFEGKKAYAMSFVIFLVIYIVPVILMAIFSDFSFGELLVMWFLLFPLFFLNYFAASGLVASIITGTYSNRHYIDKKEMHVLPKQPDLKDPKDLLNVGIHSLMLLIAWIPFLLAVWNLINPFLALASGGTDVAAQTSADATAQASETAILSAYLSLITTVVFGILGFFNRFWKKKSKTKTIDFIFSGYIFIAIAVNMLINFVAIQPDIVDAVLSVHIGSWEPLLSVKSFLSHYEVLLPIITVQAAVSVGYGIWVGLHKNSDFHADIRLAAVNRAFGLSIQDLEDPKKRQKGGKKFDIPLLVKSVLLPPVYNKFAIDVNELVRQKAGQFLYLISVQDKEKAELILDIVAKNTIERKDEEIQKSMLETVTSLILKYTGKGKGLKKVKYLSKEAVDLLGNVGKHYPELIVDRLIEALATKDVLLQKYILDALGDVGEIKGNLELILEKIKPMLSTDADELRTAAYNSIVEMITEGDTENSEFVSIALNAIYEVLEDPKSTGEVLESALTALVEVTDKIPEKIDVDKIVPLLDYEKRPDKEDNPEIISFILQNSLVILGATVYYNLDKFKTIIQKIEPFFDDEREDIRYVAADAMGNYILKGGDEVKRQYLEKLVKRSVIDEDVDVAAMCAESVAEFLIMNRSKGFETVNIDGKSQNILDFYLEKLGSSISKEAENASEALKSIVPLFKENIYDKLESFLKGDNLEVVRDLLDTIALFDKEIHLQVNIELIYTLLEHQDPTVRGKAAFCLGMMAGSLEQKIDELPIVKLLDDKDPTVRLEAIFALGKLGTIKPETISPILIERFYDLDRTKDENINETELYAESLGVIGYVYPSNEIIITLYQALLGDTNPFAKDVIARALYMIGEGMIKSGNAIRRLENDAFYNQVSWLQMMGQKKEYTIGNLMIMFLEALQQKGIPSSVMDIISDSMQDLLPVFLFLKNEKKDNEVLLTIKNMLAQAYYSNYEQEILETMDRIDSLIAFERSFQVSDPELSQEFIFYAEQFTPDGKQFHDQGEIFLYLAKDDKEFLNYALRSFEIALDLAPHEYYTPNCVLKIAEIYRLQGNKEEAIKQYQEAMNIFASLDEIEEMREIEEKLRELRA